MSADSIDRRGLERKDRSELATIVQTLGGKPGSRARKAELVDMILQLAGVPDGGGTSEGGDHDRGTAADDTDKGAGASPTPGEDDTDGGAAASDRTDGGSTAEEPSEDGDRAQGSTEETDGADPGSDVSSDAGESGTGSDDDKKSAAAGGADKGDGATKGDAAKRADRSTRTDGGDRARSGGDDRSRSDGGDDSASSDGNASGGENGSDGEPKKSRRRRGRNRDRSDDTDNGQWDGEPIAVAGTLDLRDEGYGFLRINGVLPSRDDVYVSVKQTRQFGLRRGDWITGSSRPANRSEKNPALLRIDSVNGREPEYARDRKAFEELTPLFPDEHLKLEREDHPYDLTSRIIDLLAPIGKGQRGLIVAPPKSGKTTVLKTIAQAIEANHPEVELIVMLVDERPEEVTDMRRSISGEVVASTFDRPPEEHIGLVDLVVERAKRMVEDGQDVVILLDGITRLSRAYNLAAPAGGRIMSGGLDAGALYPPKRIFGAARNIEDGGSLTILATALVETNSKMDEIIFEEFKGTGNMELRLDREAAERRIFPAIDVAGSSTRHEELLIEPQQLQQIWKLRRLLVALSSDGEEGAALDLVLDRMRKFPTNDSFLDEIGKSPAIR